MQAWAQSDWLARQDTLKWGALLGAFLVCALWESFRPRRPLIAPAGRRWLNHALITFVVNSPLALLLRANGILVAIAGAHSPYGLLNRSWPALWIRCAAAILLLDLLRYVQHYLYHRLHFFWRIHSVHHSDVDFDWSTSLLFHPGELLFSQISYLGVIALLAPPPIAVLALELGVAIQNIFVHANVRISPAIDSVLRKIVITPEMHRIHHSDEPIEQNTNFGDLFPWWDRLFGTYLAEPAAGQEKMGIGLRHLKNRLSLFGILALPFRRTDG